MEEASAYIHRQNVRYSRLGQLMEVLQIRGRALTAAEELGNKEAGHCRQEHQRDA